MSRRRDLQERLIEGWPVLVFVACLALGVGAGLLSRRALDQAMVVQQSALELIERAEKAKGSTLTVNGSTLDLGGSTTVWVQGRNDHMVETSTARHVYFVTHDPTTFVTTKELVACFDPECSSSEHGRWF